MAEMSNQNTVPVIREIPLESILPNPDNFYQLRDLDALADSIALSGLQQPLVVTPSPDKPGKFMGAYLEVKMGERKACCNCAFCGLAMDVAPCTECQGAETKYSKWAKRHPILDGPALERGPHDELL